MIVAKIKKPVELVDGENSEGRRIVGAEIGPGDYELERITNPLGWEDEWLALKGTLIGQTITAWMNLSDPRLDCVTIEEDVEI